VDKYKCRSLSQKKQSHIIPTPYLLYRIYYRQIVSACFRFFGLRFFSFFKAVGDKKDAEASKNVTSPYKCTAEAIFGGRKSENVKSYAGNRKDSDSISALCDILKLNYNNLFSFFRSALFLAPTEWGRDKIVWSVRFRRTRRTIVRRAAKSGAEKAKTLNFMQESVRIPTP